MEGGGGGRGRYPSNPHRAWGGREGGGGSAENPALHGSAAAVVESGLP